jgi:metallo-beta-lactamase family protein
MSNENKKSDVRIGFYGGVGSVTGANFLLESSQIKILIDCGLQQGLRMCDVSNGAAFPYDLGSITALIVTHAHIDHIGRIPKLVKDGFKGKIYSTEETKKLAEVMLPDAARLLVQEARSCGTPPLYEENDVAAIFGQWETIPYYAPLSLGDFDIMLQNAGHILGSAMVECTHPNIGKILFTGDLGNPHELLLKDTDSVENVNYLIMESVYGDRVHEEVQNRLAQLEHIIEKTIFHKGTLLIPTFSIERTQNILYEINLLVEKERIPQIPVFLDSPLAQKVTAIYREAKSDYNDSVRKAINKGDDIFAFEGLRVVESAEESQEIHRTPGPKIIIAGSGMSNGGRIIQHEREYLSDPNSTILTVGYQTPGSLGRQLVDGTKEVTVDRETLTVKAKILSVSGYSGHRDVNGLTDFVNGTNVALKKVFVVMGEPKSSQFLAQRLRDYLGVNAVVPNQGDIMELE